MGDHHALGRRGRARGELDEARVIAREAGVDEERRVTLEVGHGEHRLKRGRGVVELSEHRLDLTVGDEVTRARGAHDVLGVVEIAAELTHAHRGIEGHRHAAALHHPEEGRDELVRRGEHQGDAIPLLHPALAEGDRDLLCLLEQARPGVLILRPVVGDEGESVAFALGRAGQGLGDGADVGHGAAVLQEAAMGANRGPRGWRIRPFAVNERPRSRARRTASFDNSHGIHLADARR